MTSSPSISDYAVLGDCRAAALVSRRGSIDWLCWPRFDSPSIFGALLDPDRGGSFRVSPVGEARVERRYLPETNVLQTRFLLDDGVLTLTDAMAVASEQEKRSLVMAEHEIVRVVACDEGEVAIEIVFAPRPGYGERTPRMVDRGSLGIHVDASPGVLILRSDPALVIGSDGVARARVRLSAGHRLRISLSYTQEAPAVIPALGERVEEALSRTTAWWRGWSARARYGGLYRNAVIRSALALKLLQYAPSSAIVAAPTMSLPESIGGSLNWDYRYCWLRDAALTSRALLGLGYRAEAEGFINWLLHTTRLSVRRLRVLYDVFGVYPGRERIVSHLAGFAGSRPVRLRNAAGEQVQLDVYGEVIDAVARVAETGVLLDRDERRMLRAFGDVVCRRWQEPDAGLWESRGPARVNTHTLAMCWTAVDRLIALHARGCIDKLPLSRLEETRQAIRRTIETRGYSARLGSYTRALDDDSVDASLLLLGWYGFDSPSSAKMIGTYARIREQLGERAFLRRNRDFPAEGAFGICGFWGVEHLALGGGTLDEARALFEQLLASANDVGLLSEEIDPRTRAALGNFPQAFTHVGLINAALSIEARAQRSRSSTTHKPSRGGIPIPRVAYARGGLGKERHA